MCFSQRADPKGPDSKVHDVVKLRATSGRSHQLGAPPSDLPRVIQFSTCQVGVYITPGNTTYLDCTNMIPGSAVADIRNSLGVAFIGLLISTTLYGLTILQTWVYFWNYRKRDPMALKLFIIFITITDTINIILGAYMIYWYLVLNFGDIESLDHILWALSAQTAIGAVAIASLQIFYARRVYIVSQSIICPILIVVLVAFSFSFAMLSVAKELNTVLWVPCVGLGGVAVTELLIAASMCWSLYRKRTGFVRSDSIVMTLMAYTINTGLLTSLFGTAAIISLVVSPSSMIWLAFCWVMNECSINSMLALLNSRDYIRGRTSTDKTFSLSSIRHGSSVHGSKPRQTGVSVTVHHSATSDLSRNNSGPNVEPTFEVPKPDASIAPFQSPVVVQL
ncbi:hypothetical protein EDB86DRAFT_2058625 [Lactarius hatsudake]|nr:hypothetical protein EDB86DRAFT_2058625 [Lactarius hatsudake]